MAVYQKFFDNYEIIGHFRNLILHENGNQNYTLLIFSFNACGQHKRILQKQGLNSLM